MFFQDIERCLGTKVSARTPPEIFGLTYVHLKCTMLAGAPLAVNLSSLQKVTMLFFFNYFLIEFLILIKFF